MNTRIRALERSDYAEVLALRRASEGVGPSESDTEAGVAAFLARDPGTSDNSGGESFGRHARWRGVDWFAMQKPVAPRV